MSVMTINPATGKSINTYEFMSSKRIAQIIKQSMVAFSSWSTTSISERAAYIMQIASKLLANKTQYATLITTEMGKPFQSAIAEIEKCAVLCEHFAENSECYLADRLIKTEKTKSFVTYQPLGLVFAIMPWNFPFWQVFRFAIPSLMAGNTVLLKHAPITTGCALAMEDLFNKALPKYIFQVLIMDNANAKRVINHKQIAAITLTGSNETGKKIAAAAGKALKKVVLELGGNDPYIILEDANLMAACNAILASRMNNAGQSCIAAKRVLAVQSVRAKLQTLILEKLKFYKMGNPLDPDINLGPLAREDLRDHLHSQVQASINKGAKLLQGGFIPHEPGFYYPPTVLVDVKKGMPAYEEELFGPVITFIDVKDEKEAIAIANKSQYGLSAAIFTQDVARGEKIAIHGIKTGTVFVNDFVQSDPRLPFGGIKGSGYGRELSQEGIREFVNVKTISIA